MKQTAVEWLFKWMIDNKDSIIEERLQAFEQAKEMEQEQLAKSYIKGSSDAVDDLWKFMDQNG
jgi:transcription termination factor NusB